MADDPGWMETWSRAAVREVLRGGAPELAEMTVEVVKAPDPKPMWACGGARIGDGIYAKFACSAHTASRVWREAQVVPVLAELGLPVPNVIASGRSPAFVATKLVDGGVPLDFQSVSAALSHRNIDRLAIPIARFLAELHDARTHATVRARVDEPERSADVGLHPTTDALRERFMGLVGERDRDAVHRWCEWIDVQLTVPVEPVFVHGDFHPDNQLWDIAEARLIAVLDFETSLLAEPEFDFRVLPVFGPDVRLLERVVTHYERVSGRTPSISRIMAWCLLSYLGDAIWRTEAGIALSGPGDTPADYVREAADRLTQLGLDP